MLSEFAPKEASFKVNLIGGRAVEITLRPFTLGDKAWMENAFSEESERLKIANMETAPWCKIIWHQMTKESRDIFMRVKFQKVDEQTNEVIDIEPEGYERFMEALYDVKDLMVCIASFEKCRGGNGFDDVGVKKKTKRKKTKTIGSKFTTWLHRLTA